MATKVINTILNMRDNMSKGLLATAKNMEKVDKGSGERFGGNVKRGMFGRVPSTSGSAGMAAHIAQAIAQARNIVCRPVTLPLPPSGTRREIRG